MPSYHLILCCSLLLLPSIFPSIRVFSNELALRIMWPRYWSFSFSISPSNEYSWLISFRIDLFDLLTVQGTLKSLLQHDNLKASMEGWVCKCQNKDSEDTIKFHIPVSLAWGLFRDRDLRGHDRSSSEAWAPAAEAGMLLAAPPRPLGSHQAECRQTKENVLGCSYSPANRNRAQTQDSKVNTRQV